MSSDSGGRCPAFVSFAEHLPAAVWRSRRASDCISPKAYPQVCGIVTVPGAEQFFSTIAMVSAIDPLRAKAGKTFTEYFLSVARRMHHSYLETSLGRGTFSFPRRANSQSAGYLAGATAGLGAAALVPPIRVKKLSSLASVASLPTCWKRWICSLVNTARISCR